MKIFKLMLIGGGLTLSLVACKPVQVLEKPSLPEEIQGLDSLQTDSIVPWRTFFKDSQLVQMVNLALDSNFQIRTEKITSSLAEKVYNRTKFAYLPTLEAQAMGYNRQFRSDKFYSNPSSKYYEETGRTAPKNLYTYQSQFFHSLELDWELDIWGRIRDERRSNYAQWKAESANLKAVQTGIVTSIAENYFNLLMLDEQLKVAMSNYALRDSTYKLIQLQYDAGEITSLAVLQAHNQVLEASALIPGLKRDIVALENDIRLLCGQIPGSVVARKIFDNPPLDLGLLDSLPMYYIQNRPDVVQSMYLLQSSNAKIGVAQKMRLPTVQLSLTGGLNAMMPQNWFNIPGALFGGLVTGVSAPILNGGKLQLNVEIAKADRDRAELQTQQIIYEAIGDVYNCMQSYQQTRKQLSIAFKQVDITKQALVDAYLLFRSGLATYLEVINAQEQAMNTELDLAALKTRLLIDGIQLYRALGGGWY